MRAEVETTMATTLPARTAAVRPAPEAHTVQAQPRSHLEGKRVRTVSHAPARGVEAGAEPGGKGPDGGPRARERARRPPSGHARSRRARRG